MFIFRIDIAIEQISHQAAPVSRVAVTVAIFSKPDGIYRTGFIDAVRGDMHSQTSLFLEWKRHVYSFPTLLLKQLQERDQSIDVYQYGLIADVLAGLVGECLMYAGRFAV